MAEPGGGKNEYHGAITCVSHRGHRLQNLRLEDLRGGAGSVPVAMEAPRHAWHSRAVGFFNAFGGGVHCRSQGYGLSEQAPKQASALTRLNSLQVPVSPSTFGELCCGALAKWQRLTDEEKAAQCEGLALFASRGLRWHVGSLDASVPSCALLQALATSGAADAVIASGGPSVMLDAAKARGREKSHTCPTVFTGCASV